MALLLAGALAFSPISGSILSLDARANHMPLSKLAEKNPQVKNIDLIRVGQKINL